MTVKSRTPYASLASDRLDNCPLTLHLGRGVHEVEDCPSKLNVQFAHEQAEDDGAQAEDDRSDNVDLFEEVVERVGTHALRGVSRRSVIHLAAEPISLTGILPQPPGRACDSAFSVCGIWRIE
jgi:hypothetical protein